MQSHANPEKFTPFQALLEAICKGEAEAYQTFSNEFDDTESYQLLTNHLFSAPSHFETIDINALIEIADLIEDNALKYPDSFSQNAATHVLLEAAAKRGSFVACIVMGRLAQENFQYDVAEAHFKRASDLNNNEGYYYLVKLYKLQGRYQEATTILQGALATLSSASSSSSASCSEKEIEANERRTDIETKLGEIKYFAAIKTQQSYLRTLYHTQKCIVYFDFDDTLIKAARSPRGYYLLSLEQQTALKGNLANFIIASQQEWLEIFTNLRERGFIIGLCTARSSENGKDEMYDYFMQQFGTFFAPEHILFTAHKSKALAIISQCRLHQINLQNVLLVDDYKINTEECAAYGIATIFVEALSYKPQNFAVFKQHLLQRTQTILEQRPPFVKKVSLSSNAHALLPSCKERKKPTPSQLTSRDQSPIRPAPLTGQEERRSARKTRLPHKII